MEPETADETYPLIGRVSLPRMITAQFDSILYSKILDSYGQLVLADLEACCFLKSPKAWWSTYASMFILLREAAWITADRYRHARNNYGSKVCRDSQPQSALRRLTQTSCATPYPTSWRTSTRAAISYSRTGIISTANTGPNGPI